MWEFRLLKHPTCPILFPYSSLPFLVTLFIDQNHYFLLAFQSFMCYQPTMLGWWLKVKNLTCKIPMNVSTHGYQALNIYGAKHPKSPLSSVYIWYKKKEKIDRTIIPWGGKNARGYNVAVADRIDLISVSVCKIRYTVHRRPIHVQCWTIAYDRTWSAAINSAVVLCVYAST